MCVPGLSRLAQISLTMAFHRSSVETRTIGKTMTMTTITLTSSQNVVLSDFNQILLALCIHLLSTFFLPRVIELIALIYSYTIQTCEYHYQGASLRKDNNHRHARSSRCNIGQVQMISSSLDATQVCMQRCITRA